MPKITILVIGEKGAGKTSLMKLLAVDYSDNVDNKEDYVFYEFVKDVNIFIRVNEFPNNILNNSILFIDCNKLPSKEILSVVNVCLVLITEEKIDRKLKKKIKRFRKINQCPIVFAKNKIDNSIESKDKNIINISVRTGVGIEKLMDTISSKNIPASA